MGIISISQPGSERFKNLPQITQCVSGRTGLLLQLLESHSRAPSTTDSAVNLEKPSKHYMIEVGPTGFLAETNTNPAHRKLCSLCISATLHWSIQSCRTSIWRLIRLRVGQEMRAKQGWQCQDYLTFEQDREEIDWPEEPGATGFQCPTCSVAHQESWAFLCLLLRVVQQKKTGPRSSWGAAHVSNGLTAQPFQLAW